MEKKSDETFELTTLWRIKDFQHVFRNKSYRDKDFMHCNLIGVNHLIQLCLSL